MLIRIYIFCLSLVASSFVIASTDRIAESSVSYPAFITGVKTGYQIATDETYDGKNPDAYLAGIFAAIQISTNLRWDVGFQYQNDFKAVATSTTIKTSRIETALRYDWYLNHDLSLYGRLGASYWDIEKDSPGVFETMNAKGLSPLGEIGLGFHISPNVQLSTGFQYIDSIGNSNTGEYDNYSLVFELSYHFAKTPTVIASPSVTPTTDNQANDTETNYKSPIIYRFTENLFDGGLLFASNKTNIDIKYMDTLKKIATVLKKDSKSKLMIVGHADSSGSKIYNQNLSERRALAVANILKELGVNSDQLTIIGKGETTPIATNETEQGRSQNRRVIVTFLAFLYQNSDD
ncbi:OmpA family protein [Vibrio kasasachensis]|uniref:OmpA family protein n=1 Tax=Vibrio kasasachensis TaxID=2910248 RepID=UPI003D14B02B